MNKFMGGLTLGIFLTAGVFIFFHPFQKKVELPDPVDSLLMDSTALQQPVLTDSAIPLPVVANYTGTKVNRDSLVVFAKSLLGIPYLYGSTDPARGFDCSGFVTYVFNHFNILVPRSSGEFQNIGIKRSMNDCLPGDIMVFTGTDPVERTIGHIGIVSEITAGVPSFIHSSSGKANGVTITSMSNKFYQDRFVSIIDLLAQ
ncbi:MAG: C40 family peptidase [Ferruginibacter sp.]